MPVVDGVRIWGMFVWLFSSAVDQPTAQTRPKNVWEIVRNGEKYQHAFQSSCDFVLSRIASDLTAALPSG